MPSFTLKNVPAEIIDRLRQQAARNGRSANGEAIACLRAVLMAQPVDVEAFLARVRHRRKAFLGRVTERELGALKRKGLP